MSKKMKKLGQGMTEYVIIVVLVAVAVLGAVKLFGEALDKKVDEATGRVTSME